MKKCNKDCATICDFCKYYHFNGTDYYKKDKNGKNYIIPRAIYSGDGYCGLDLSQKDPADSCKNFYCRNVNIIERLKLILFKLKNYLNKSKND